MTEAERTSKGRRRAIKIGGGLLVALGLMFGVKTAVAEVYRVPLASMELELPAGSRVLVYKLADTFSPGQIAVFHGSGGQACLGRVEAHDRNAGIITLSRNGTGLISVAERDVIGRVVLNTR